MKKRAAIYFFFDENGIVDNYVDIFLNDFSKSIDKLIVVSNGKLTVEGRNKFLKYTKNIIVRDNKGFDVWAFKEGLDFLKFENFKKYFEVILLNHTIMGPVYSFETMFNEMDEKKLDFWGITSHQGSNYDPFGCSPFGYLPKHIQSHFISFRQNVLSSEIFKKYWDNLSEINSYGDSVGKHETYLTKHLEDNGFNWDVYCNSDDYSKLTPYPLMDMPIEMINEKKCPIFKRKNFIIGRDHYLQIKNDGDTSKKLLKYIENNNLYDLSALYENIIRTTPQSVLIESLGLQYLSINVEKEYAKQALVINVEFNLDDIYIKQLNEIDHSIDVYYVTNDQETCNNIKNKVNKFKEVVVSEIKNPKNGKLFYSMKKFNLLSKYEYTFFYSIDEININKNMCEFSKLKDICNNTFGNKNQTNGYIQIMTENPHLGFINIDNINNIEEITLDQISPHFKKVINKTEKNMYKEDKFVMRSKFILIKNDYISKYIDKLSKDLTITDENYFLSYITRVSCKLIGYASTKDDILNQKVNDLYYKSERQTILNYIKVKEEWIENTVNYYNSIDKIEKEVNIKEKIFAFIRKLKIRKV